MNSRSKSGHAPHLLSLIIIRCADSPNQIYGGIVFLFIIIILKPVMFRALARIFHETRLQSG